MSATTDPLTGIPGGRNAPGAQASSTQLSEGVRGLVSLAIIVHLIGLALVFLCNSNSYETGLGGSYLARRAKAVFDWYLHPLWLNRPYDYHFTHGGISDYDAVLTAKIRKPDGTGEELVHLPPEDLSSGLRRDRYLHLAGYLAMRAATADTGDDELLPTMIGGQLLKQWQARYLVLDCDRKTPLILSTTPGLAASIPTPPSTTVYSTEVFLLGSKPQLNKIGEARDVAPVVKPGTNRGTTPGADPSTKTEPPAGNPAGTSTPGKSSADPLRLPFGPPLESTGK